ncbi:hypothetical protein ACTWQF_03825 [Streptomyces sp. 8N114]|uniref:hypothetical protein n=1 Tax=Streptomyces sp. 8N114 TaxID=3457419 RepID=UPI003FD4C2B8
MNLSMSITPPSNQSPLTPDFDLSTDYESLVMDSCELLSQTNCKFEISGFGQDSWPVDVSYDLSSVIEQLPAALTALQKDVEAVIDLYGQGIERALTFTPGGETVTIRCSSRSRWQPDPSEEQAVRQDVHRLFTNLAREFKAALESACPIVAETPPFADW